MEVEIDIDGVRAWERNLWHEDIPTLRVLFPNEEYVWMVTTDLETPTEVIQFMLDAVVEFGEPRVPRDWGIPTEYWFD